MSKILSFEDLECWKKATLLSRAVSKLIKTFPSDEKYLLVDQMKRASRSVTNNIAEGYGRYHFQENIQYCRQSRGSLHELIDHYIIAFDEGCIDKTTLRESKELINSTLAILNGYINYLKKAKENN